VSGLARVAGPAWLVLFDIDGTLLDSGSVGRQAMGLAGHALQGRPFELDGVPFAGKLDRNISREILARHGLPDDEATHARFRAAYVEHLTVLLDGARGRVRPLAGMVELLAALGARDDVVPGLLTGNFPESGALKLRHAGLAADAFGVCAWGCDADRREDLLPVALARCGDACGWTPGPERVVVLGDTPDDVAVARAHGARCLAVTTGQYDREVLGAAGPARVLDDVRDTDDVVGWIVGGG